MFDDLNNSDHYKECLRRAYEAGNKNFYTSIPENIPQDEKFACPALDDFLNAKGFILNDYQKINIYLLTLYWNEHCRKMNEWQDQQIKRLKELHITPSLAKPYKAYSNHGWNVTDQTLAACHEEYEYARYKELDIPGFPKTYRTYQKHKEANSEKYQAWIAYAKEVDHGKD